MDVDVFRKRVEVEMYCSKHPETKLCISTESKFEASSAYVSNAKVFIYPCSQCRRDAERIKDAARVLMSVSIDK